MEVLIRKMELQEIEIAMYLAYKEGWNPGLNDGLAFFNTDPDGFLLAEVNGEVVGCISAVSYSDDYGFIGFYIVDAEHRLGNAGAQLALNALKYLSGKNIGIDGVLNRVKNYEKIGFKLAYKNVRFESIGGQYFIDEHILPLKEIDFNQLVEYDKHCFPVKREKFLKDWTSLPNIHTYGYLKDGKLMGYGTVRPCRKGFKIGPLFADNLHIADEIYKALSNHAVDDYLYYDAPEANPNALILAERYEMRKVFETARMYNKEEPIIDLNKIFGVTSFELG